MAVLLSTYIITVSNQLSSLFNGIIFTMNAIFQVSNSSYMYLQLNQSTIKYKYM